MKRALSTAGVLTPVILLAVYLTGFPVTAGAALDIPRPDVPSAGSIFEQAMNAQQTYSNNALQESLNNPPDPVSHGEEAAAITCDVFSTLWGGSCGSSGSDDNGGGSDDGSGGSDNGNDGGNGGNNGGGSGTGTTTDDGTDENSGGTSNGGGTPTSGGSTSSGGGGGGGIPSLFGVVNSGYATPLGMTASTCSQYLTANIKRSSVNDVEQVRRLQTFLRDFEHFDITVTGEYDVASYEAVKAFQIRYAADVLIPWGLTQPSGYVYHTTKKKVNEVYCKTAFPLTAEQESEISGFKNTIKGLPAPLAPEITGSIGLGGNEVAKAIAAATAAEQASASTETPVVVEASAEAQVAAASDAAEQSGIFSRLKDRMRGLWGRIRGIFPR